MLDILAKGYWCIRQILKNRYFYLVFYALISLAILGSLLLPGAIFTLDMRYGPNIQVIPQFYGLYANPESIIRLAWYSVIFLLNKIFPFWLWQKLLFFFVFFIMGVNAHRLAGGKSRGSYFAGLLYILNPFTYVRFLAGQFVVLAVYALTPLAIKAFLDLMETRSTKNAIRVALTTSLVGAMYEHGFLLLFFAFLIMLGVKLIALRHKAPILETIEYTAYAAAIFIPLNIYWLLPFLTTPRTIVENIGYFDLIGFAAATTSQLGVMFDVASMYGFWRGGYTYTKDLLPGWWLFFAFILFLAVYGYLSFFRDKKTGWIVKSFAFIGIASFILAVGAGSRYTRPLFEWLWQHIPYISIFRDSQKFVGLLGLSYAFLGALAVDKFVAEFKRQKAKYARLIIAAVLGLSLITPIIYSFTMFGFNGQLGVTDYPTEWYEVNNHLNQDESDSNVLFLPWHEFMDFSWLPNRDKRLGNPARSFFDKPVIQGDNIEMPGIYTQNINPISDYVTFLLGKNNEINNLGELLAPLNVKYVILVNEADYRNYDFLYKQDDLKTVLSLPGITLFKNEHKVARVYGVNSRVYIKNLEEYLKLSKTQEVMEHLYIFGDGVGEDGSGMQKLDSTEVSQVKYEVGETASKYTIFTVSQNINTEYWTYNGNKAMENLGFMPSFLSNTSGGEIIYRRFYQICLPGYIISIMTLLMIITYLILIYARPSYISSIKRWLHIIPK